MRGAEVRLLLRQARRSAIIRQAQRSAAQRHLPTSDKKVAYTTLASPQAPAPEVRQLLTSDRKSSWLHDTGIVSRSAAEVRLPLQHARRSAVLGRRTAASGYMTLALPQAPAVRVELVPTRLSTCDI